MIEHSRYAEYAAVIARRGYVVLTAGALVWLALAVLWFVHRRAPRLARWLGVGVFYASLVAFAYWIGAHG